VVHALAGAGLATLAGVPLRFSTAEIVYVSGDAGDLPTGDELGAPLNRLDLTLDHLRALLKLPATWCHPSQAVMAAIAHMVRHYCRNPLTVHAIRGCVSVSDDHLARSFHAAFGWPATTYYTRLRVEVACRLLCDTDEKIDQIAEQVGIAVGRTSRAPSRA